MLRKPDEPFVVPQLLTQRLLLLVNTLGKGAVRLYAGRYDLPLPEWRMLAVLALEAPSSVSALAMVARADKSWVSRVTGALVEKGYARLKPDPSDGRRTQVDLTAAGRRLYARILPAAKARHARLVSVLTADEQVMLDHIVDKLQRHADYMLVENPGVLRPKARRSSVAS